MNVKKIIIDIGIIVSAITISTGVLAGGGCAPASSSEAPIPLDEVEIREYEGEQLSSITEFRENSIKGPQQVAVADYTLAVTGLVAEPKEFSYDEVIGNYQAYEKVVTLDCVEGWSVKLLWEGVLVSDLIGAAKPSDDTKIVIFHAYDGYTTSLPINYIKSNNILLAYKMNGLTLPPERGFPFELVAESKWGYKWIKWVTEIELSDDVDYRGFWESRGYSNSADLDKGFFEEDFFNGGPIAD